jgi:hypothetical protein
MISYSKLFRSLTLLVGLSALLATLTFQGVLASDIFKDIKGVVKSVDKGTKTMVVKTADGTEHTIKWAGEKTAVAVRDASKASAKAVTQ